MPERIEIVGGGLAGLALGLGLRQRGVPVRVHEAGAYPRVRVCGEFLSGAGRGVLARLGLAPELARAGAIEARHARFALGARTSPRLALPRPALCLPRPELEAVLARAFEGAGGELVSAHAWHGDAHAPGLVLANGRRPRAADPGASPPAANAWRWYGLRAHVRGLELEADLELHFGRDEYVGLSRQSGGRVNVCGLYRRRDGLPDLRSAWRELMAGAPDAPLAQRLRRADFDESSFAAVAGLELAPRRALHGSSFAIGDALTLTPPLTGNGMSMALESAEYALGPLEAWSRGALAWGEARAAHARVCDREFSQRLRWASFLQRALFHAPTRALVFGAAARWPGLWQLLHARTR
jgi:2-polyprenyl-6-methoxyphenol hydroxylase-like FAD-dependent oxidoreductase